ncbi:hypothetical protein CYQ88_03735 [Hydrogenovibrio sp. SC-1]|uniref:glycine cleavage system protein R n=1 Tax=Hydrogenovibrio sp. SC-1 TaxID=2065820 RepID=UPI000C7AD80A|nr:ACT domain-containing protein [Hydrogenovibrio sp. SC-1]PLA75020.1 hypothetical protein CYQ88_03735 [Hydrogenovibrio sp. SC-1]
MKQSIVISVLGEDSPGLVESLSKLVVAHQGDWVESRMASLAGQFAGILQVDLPIDQVQPFSQALEQADFGLKVIFEAAVTDATQAPMKTYQLELVGQDRPGIIHKLSSVLAQLNVNVDELETEVVEASMSGEHLFKASIRIEVSAADGADAIADALEAIANELIVDIELAES